MVTDAQSRSADDAPGFLWGHKAIAAFLGWTEDHLRRHLDHRGPLSAVIYRAEGIKSPWARERELMEALLGISRPIGNGSGRRAGSKEGATHNARERFSG